MINKLAAEGELAGGKGKVNTHMVAQHSTAQLGLGEITLTTETNPLGCLGLEFVFRV